MRPEDFTPIGPTALTVTRGSLNAAGNSAGQAGAVASQDDTRLVAWLAARSPAEVDEAARSQASRRGVELRTRTEGRYPEGRPSYSVVVSCDAIGGDQVALEADLRKLMVPAPIRKIEGWLAELSVIVARREGDEMSEALRLSAYSGRLARYPADVARAALLDHSWRFWPTWEELDGVCNALVSPRRWMIAACGAEANDEARRVRPAGELERMREMASRFAAEMDAQDRERQPPRIPHWSETAAPDDPRWAALRKARAANAIVGGGA